MNPRSYEATSDEYPDLFPAFKEPDIQFATSSYYALKVSSSLRKPTSDFLDIGKQAGFASRTHSDE